MEIPVYCEINITINKVTADACFAVLVDGGERQEFLSLLCFVYTLVISKPLHRSGL